MDHVSPFTTEIEQIMHALEASLHTVSTESTYLDATLIESSCCSCCALHA